MCMFMYVSHTHTRVKSCDVHKSHHLMHTHITRIRKTIKVILKSGGLQLVWYLPSICIILNLDISITVFPHTTVIVYRVN